MSPRLENYPAALLLTSLSNMESVSPSRVGLMRKRVRRYFYEIIGRPAQSHTIRAQYGLSIVLLGIWVFFVLLLFHIWILAPKLGVCWIRKLWTLRTELWFLKMSQFAIYDQAFVTTTTGESYPRQEVVVNAVTLCVRSYMLLPGWFYSIL